MVVGKMRDGEDESPTFYTWATGEGDKVELGREPNVGAYSRQRQSRGSATAYLI
jgi:hypothetical protein